jgi:hypothetical protein
VLVHDGELDRSPADRPIAVPALASFECGHRTLNADELDRGRLRSPSTSFPTDAMPATAVRKPRTVAGGPAGKCIGPVAPSTNVMEPADTHVEQGTVQRCKQLVGNDLRSSTCLLPQAPGDGGRLIPRCPHLQPITMYVRRPRSGTTIPLPGL